MEIIKPTFSKDKQQAIFFSVLKERVNVYFKNSNLSKYGNWNMILKSVVMFLLYFTPYILLLTFTITNPYIFFGLWILTGIGMAGIGLSVMHDANHGSYSKHKWINKLLGYSMNLIGANAEIWKIQHNKLHHTYTNIVGADDDLNPPKFLRFSPYTKKYKIHKYQFIYVWFFYGLATISWFTTKEFIQLFRYKKMGIIKGRKKFRNLLTQLIAWKLLYFSYMIVVPLLLISAPTWWIILGFILMHFATGLILSLIFQTAHVMPNCAFSLAQKDVEIENNWAIHEMITTTNYAPGSKIFSWFIGGLNYQVEHHLFPSICHVHYSKISKIVAATAREFDVPYNSQKSFTTALWEHGKMLYHLGRTK